MIALRVVAALILSGVLLHAPFASGETAADEPSKESVVAPRKRLNVLLVTIDTQRADSFGIYGNAGGHTPNIDRLAQRSVVFERATSPVGTTFPSHASLLTGLYPRRHGVRYNGDALDEEMVTLAEILREEGYDTMALVSYGSMVSRGGLAQGFIRTSHEVDGTPAYRTNPRRVTTMARGLLKHERKNPFFMWVQYYHPHSPYDVTPYAKAELEDYDGAFADGATVKEFYKVHGKGEFDDDDRKALRTLYDGETREADRVVGLLLDDLEKRGLADDTIVVVTSDHGEVLGEHGVAGHGPLLWQPVLSVPLVVHDPRSPEPRRVEERVGLVDVAPTLLEMLGLPPRPGLDGRSLVAAMKGEPLEERPYYSEVNALNPQQQKKKAERDEDAVVVFLGDHKLIVQDGESKLFDLAKDPAELAPVLDVAKDPRGAELAALAASYGKRRPRSKGQTDPGDLAPKVEAELRALGYVQ